MSITNKFLNKVKEEISKEQVVQVIGDNPGFKSFLCLDLAKACSTGENKKLIFLCASEKECSKWSALFTKQHKRLKLKTKIFELLPSSYWDLSQERKNTSIRFERIAALNFLKNEQSPGVVITTLQGLLQKTINHANYSSALKNLTLNQNYNPEDLEQKLVNLGYKKSSFVIEKGSFACRGAIFDIFSPSEKKPIRLEFFDDEIISMHQFNPESQRTQKQRSHYKLAPCWGDSLTEDKKNEQREFFYALMREKNLERRHQESLLESFDLNPYLFEFERVSASLNKNLSNNLENLGEKTKLILLDPKQEILNNFSQSLESLNTLYLAIEDYPYLLTSPEDHFEKIEFFERFLSKCNYLEFSSFIKNPKAHHVSYSDFMKKSSKESLSLAPNKKRKDLSFQSLEIFYKKGYRVIVLFGEEKSLSIFGKILANKDLKHKTEPLLEQNFTQFLSKKHSNEFILSLGFIEGHLEDPDAQTIIYNGQDLITPPKQKKRIAPSELLTNQDLEIKDYVTHIKHGTGQYLGLKKLNVSSTFFDFVKIAYKNSDILYLPVENIGSLKKYKKYSESQDKPITLDKLGGMGWRTRKNKVQKNIEELAKELLKSEAQRKARKGPELGEKSSLYHDFCEDFPYNETDDQKKSIEEVEEDLCSSYPMDRLLVGDVGFGKTEVAMRAAMYSVVEGFQVLVFVPTTVLCEQHYFRFLQRFSKYGITVGCLNRYHKKKSSSIIQDFSNQKLDILVGTHALFSPSIKTTNLGLVILDEEHKMGVSQKKKLKDIAKSANFLTMTATPIPRTLNMSLLGLRDTSLIKEAPQGRLPIKTFFYEKNKKIINNAITFEIERSGQIIYLHNTIENLPTIKESLQKDFPKIPIAIAHGKMSALEIEKNMLSFSKDLSKILLTTTIVESGIDIPNVNTLIVSDCEKYGLSQLHQLRGRIGRSQTQAYAYFFYREKKKLTDLAQKRMAAIVSHDSLGAGFHLAATDMSIRGVGNLLGTEQSGDINSVGIDRYIEMLEQAVYEIKTGQKKPETYQPEIKIKEKAGISDSYIENEIERLNTYRSIFKAQSKERIEEIFELTRSLYGKWPHDFENLYLVSLIKHTLIALQAKSLKQVFSPPSYELIISIPKQGIPSNILTYFKENSWPTSSINPFFIKVNLPPFTLQQTLKTLIDFQNFKESSSNKKSE